MPDTTVSQLENDLVGVGGLTQAMASTSLSNQRANQCFPVRPAFGTAGDAVVVWANYFPLKVTSSVLWRYTLEVADVSAKKGSQGSAQKGSAGRDVKGRKLFLVICRLLKELDSKVPIATEFRSQLIAAEKLDLPAQPIRIELPFESDPDKSDIFNIHINGPFEVPLAELAAYLHSQDRGPDDKLFPRFPGCVDALNIVFGHMPRSRSDQITPVGSARFFPFEGPETAARDLNGGRPLVALRGFFQSSRISTGRLLLNVNPTCGTFKASGPLDAIMDGLQLAVMGQPNLQSWQRSSLNELAKVLPKTRVAVTMIVGSPPKKITRKKAIHQLVRKSKLPRKGSKVPRATSNKEFLGPKDVEFWREENGSGEYVTVYDHYKESEL